WVEAFTGTCPPLTDPGDPSPKTARKLQTGSGVYSPSLFWRKLNFSGRNVSVAGLKDELAALKIDQSDRGSGGRRGVWVALALVAGIALLGGWYWSTRVQAAGVKVATVETIGGSRSVGGTVLNASGYVTARRRATVSSKVTGKVTQIFIEEGQSVREGQILATLDDSQ